MRENVCDAARVNPPPLAQPCRVGLWCKLLAVAIWRYAACCYATAHRLALYEMRLMLPAAKVMMRWLRCCCNMVLSRTQMERHCCMQPCITTRQSSGS